MDRPSTPVTTHLHPITHLHITVSYHARRRSHPSVKFADCLALLATMVSPTQWLVKRDGKWGCSVCVAARNMAASQKKDTSKWRYVAFAHFHVQTLKTGNVHRHERCKAHRDALKQAGLPAASQEGEEGDEGDAPTVDQIMQLWKRRQNSCSLSMPVDDFPVAGTGTANSSGALRRPSGLGFAPSSKPPPLSARR